MKIPMLDLKRQFKKLEPELMPLISDCLKSGIYIMGENVASLETELADYLGVKHTVAVASGTDALILSLRALGIGSGDEVITTPFTFFATAEAVAAVGAVPVFADVREDTYNIDPQSIRQKITPRTKAILPVHIFGQPADMDEIETIAKENNLKIIEDACQAIGSKYRSRYAGTIGDTGCFSFFPTKNLGAFGDGGLIATNDDATAVVCRALREHCGGKTGAAARDILEGRPAQEEGEAADPLYNPYKYFNYFIGYNSRLDALQAVILRTKLKYLNEWNNRRAEHADYYRRALSGCGLILPGVPDGVHAVWHQFALRTGYKAEMGAYLAEKGIASGVFYPVPLHLQKAFDHLGYHEGDLPVSEMLAKQTLCLPVFPELTCEELSYIADTVKLFCSQHGNE